MVERARISITGVVQGVGFRPYVYSLATRMGINGYVSNTASGVQIEAEGERLTEFLERLPREAPPLARVADISVASLPRYGYSSFLIRDSVDLPGFFTLVSPDTSVCVDCLRELQDPFDRRYRYPFINCTNCGPRYSITRGVPYDRPNTTMSTFRMCPDCDREYHDPLDRRFHAQPNACPACGPKIRFEAHRSRFSVRQDDPIDDAIKMLKAGGIVAIKGLGGFHISCDAANDRAVRTLRERKRKSNKPFAVMVASVEAAGRFCHVDDRESAFLLSRQRPVVLLKKRTASGTLSEAVSPNNQYFGVMLPYTPLHSLLFMPPTRDAPDVFDALVMTSGNLSEEPIVRDNEEAVGKLGSLVDAFLFHDRNIFMRVDDSVIRVLSSQFSVHSKHQDGKGGFAPDTGNSDLSTENPEPGTANSERVFIRRSRGYAPEPIPLHAEGPEVLGCGADLKNTFTLTRGAWAVPSQHIGDMENYETLRFYEETLENLKQVYRVDPQAIVHDLHPGYLSTRWAKEQGSGESIRNRIKLFGIQHHYAHIGSVMAEKGLTSKVIGIAFDGTGYGADGNLWGGEFLVADVDGFERVAQLAYIPLPGGEAAIREPWRTAASLVRTAYGKRAYEYLEQAGLAGRIGAGPVRQVLDVSSRSELSPLASGAGRYFDAMAALIGVCDRNTFEGEAAMALESLVIDGCDEVYDVEYRRGNEYTEIDLSSTVRAVLSDLSSGVDHGRIATRFHNSMVRIMTGMTGEISAKTGIRDVALSGGIFQNRYLLLRAKKALHEAGMAVHINSLVPPNDACISLGQAFIVRERLRNG